MRLHIAAEVRAEMARQRKTVEAAGVVLHKSKQAASAQWRGARDFKPRELTALAEWLGVDVKQWLPPGYLLLVGPGAAA